MIFGLPPKETWASAIIFLPTASAERDSGPVATNTLTVCLPVLRLRIYIAERDVGQIIAVVIDVEAIDCVGMKCVGIGICIEDDHGFVLVGGRLECVQVAEVESLIAEWRAKTESGEM